MTLAGCMPKTFYQIYKTAYSQTMFQKDNTLVYEDDNCTVTYNLWSEYGNAGFAFFNKSEENIYVNLGESFFIRNGMAYDYYQSRTFSESQSVTFQERKTICIPPNAAKIVYEYNIQEALFKDCDLPKSPTKKQIITKTYSEQNTPIVFGNIISYTVGQTEKNIVIKNDFYVSQITNYPESEAATLGEFLKLNHEDAAPYKFYIRYTYTIEYQPHRLQPLDSDGWPERKK
jgi:hypothetical protein